MTFVLPNGAPIAYPDLVAKLAKPGDKIVASLDGAKAHAWHMASCVPGEAGELFDWFALGEQLAEEQSRENLIEELGDIEFYLEGLRQVTGIERTFADSAVNCATMQAWLALPGRAADVFDVVKRWTIYDKPLDRANLIMKLVALDCVLDSLYQYYGIDRDVALQENVTKLGKRYVELVYSDAAAQARADKEPGQ